MGQAGIELTVNGVLQRVEAAPDTTLLTYLRNVLGLTGCKDGCSQGHCGTCTVIVDGRAQRACLLRLGRLHGAQVQTIEGLSTPSTVHALQYAFVRQGAVQCGYCTPGMIMAAKALLDANPDPDDAAIRAALAHNLCRCTGYVKIVAAVREAAAMVRRGEAQVPRERVRALVSGGVGASAARLDGIERATGTLRYTADLNRPGQLWGRALRSRYPHAEVLSIDATEARRAPGVAAVLTAADVPGSKHFGELIADQPVLAVDRVRFVGDAVAVVYAETEAQAAAALNLIAVEYRELPVVDSPEAALRPEAPALHASGNLLREVHIRKGDIEAGWAEAEIIVEGTYRTPFIEHAYMEPEACLAEPDPALGGTPPYRSPLGGAAAGGGNDEPSQGGVVVYVGSQGPWCDQRQIVAALDLPPERVRVVRMPVGGAFGGKEDITLQIVAALGALRLGRPVKMVIDRRESIRVSSKRHAEVIHYRTGARRDGRLTAVEVTIHADTGAYASLGPSVIFRSASFACGPYVVPNVKVDAYLAYTNNVPCGAMRGFGNPQVTFACEQQMDELARRLGMDPFALRELNALRPGQATATGDVLGASVGALPTLEAVRQALAQVRLPAPRPGKRIGVGVATSFKNVGLGGGLNDEAEARLSLEPDGTLMIRTGCSDLGGGAETAMAQLAAEVTGVPLGAMRVHAGDTREDPRGGMTTASRETFITGNAVVAAARAWRARALAAAAEVLGREAAEIDLRDGRLIAVAPLGQSRHRAQPPTVPPTGGNEPECARGGAQGGACELSLAELGTRLAAQGRTLEAVGRYAADHTRAYKDVPARPYDPAEHRLHVAYCFGTQAAVVEVDEATGEVEVLEVIAAHDAGTIINPQAVEGQIEGGVMMGLGYALSEEFVMREGRIVTDTLRKLGVLGIERMPAITAIAVENPHPEGPLGAKGMGELPASATAPAILNAIYDAVGVRIRELPATPARVRAAMGTDHR